MFIYRWMDKEEVVHVHSGILLSHKKNEIMSFAATRMDLEIIILSKPERQTPFDITCTWNLKYGTNEPIYEAATDSQTQTTHLWLSRAVEEGWTGSLQLPNHYT